MSFHTLYTFCACFGLYFLKGRIDLLQMCAQTNGSEIQPALPVLVMLLKILMPSKLTILPTKGGILSYCHVSGTISYHLPQTTAKIQLLHSASPWPCIRLQSLKVLDNYCGHAANVSPCSMHHIVLHFTYIYIYIYIWKQCTYVHVCLMYVHIIYKYCFTSQSTMRHSWESAAMPWVYINASPPPHTYASFIYIHQQVLS